MNLLSHTLADLRTVLDTVLLLLLPLRLGSCLAMASVLSLLVKSGQVNRMSVERLLPCHSCTTLWNRALSLGKVRTVPTTSRIAVGGHSG